MTATVLAVRVLDADRDATAGPWSVVGTVTAPAEDAGTWVHGGVGMDERAVAVTLPYSPYHEPDASLIALYRTAAPTLARQVQAVLALHQPVQEGGCCGECWRGYPCPTVRALGDDRDA